MKFKLDTPKGKYVYKYVPVYNGVKVIDKVIAKENLLLFKSIASKYDFVYGLAYGSLLGALREHDFIAHDEDIDLFAFRSQMDVFKTMLWELRDNGFELIRMERTEAFASIMRKGEYIDFYFFRPLCEGYHEAFGYPLPNKFLDNFVEVDFQGDRFLAPENPEDEMVFLYGPDWQVPVQYNNYEMGAIRKLKVKLQWWLYYTMPYPICIAYLKRRLPIKIENANKRIRRYNRFHGTDVLTELPLSIVDKFKY